MTKHIQLLSSPRSGSTYLAEVIREYIHPAQDQLPYWYGDPFNGLINEDELSIAVETSIRDKIAYLKTYKNTLVISNHIRQIKSLKHFYPNLYDEFVNVPMQTIVLIRRDLFERALSHLLADHTGKYERYDYAGGQFNASWSDLKRYIINHARQTQRIIKFGTVVDYHEIVYYEDLSGIPDVDFARLSVCHSEIAPYTIQHSEKQGNKSKMILNYEKLKELATEFIPTLPTVAGIEHLTFTDTLITHIEFDI